LVGERVKGVIRVNVVPAQRLVYQDGKHKIIFVSRW